MLKLIIEIPKEVKQAFDKANKDDINFSFYDYNSVIGKAIKNGVPLDDIKTERYNQGFVDGYKKATEQANACIDDIKTEIPILSHWQTDDGQNLLMVADALECIDKHTGRSRANDRQG